MRITISRPTQVMDIGRDYTIHTQNEVLGSVPRGESRDVEIPEDAELIFASLGGFTSVGIPIGNLRDGSHLEVSNNVGGWKLLIPLLPVYYYVIARNKYLKLVVLEQT